MAYGLRQLAAGSVALAVTAAANPAARGQGLGLTQTDPAAIVQSQESQSGQFASTWLASADARVLAWGAYVALRDRRHELLPQLVGLAKAYTVKTGPLGGRDRDEHDAMLSVLDAVIQLEGRIPAEASETLYPEFPVQSLILLSHSDRTADDFLLKIFREESKSTRAWLAAGNLLMNRTQCSWPAANCRLKVPGFASAVLGGLTVNAEISVVDQGRDPARRPMGVGGSCPFGLPGPQTGWPPVGNYYADDGYPAPVLMVSGADPSFYFRSVAGPDPDRARSEICPWPTGVRNTLREHLLARLVGESPEVPSVRSFVRDAITWRSDRQFLNDLQSFVDRQQHLFIAISGKLTDAGLLSDQESASTRPGLEVQVYDDRVRKLPALLALQDPGNHVHIMIVR